MATTTAPATHPDDDDWNEESQLCANLSTANTHITRYILRHLDADAGRTTPTPPHDEHHLGRTLINLGNRLATRALNRRVNTVWNTFYVINPPSDGQ
ncbi:hypothetical protein [Actinokineospora sp. NBRC 105648]|uniref:hypothetical protein n=1 Tax=Actinokineospora sp. NBRC 105648 TaxID=3032206 RepID=UPI0024A13A34|nr:hypothetical protein [Actinokineospora sp. NBRC 105648]GLZ37158.1 hypothetical protein Acsp05_07830 [Actinokineospora sp. NBRC 105648]